MASDKTPAARDPVRDMAAQIYIHITSSAIKIEGDSAKLAANPDGLAKVSFKLAEAFMKVEAERHASTKPVHAVLDLDKIDFGD